VFIGIASLTGRVAIDQQANEDVILCASYSTGFKSPALGIPLELSFIPVGLGEIDSQLKPSRRRARCSPIY